MPTSNHTYSSYSKNAILTGLALASHGANIDFIETFQYTKHEPEAYECLKDNELTKMCMAVSERSLAEGWENEDDSHWASFELIP